MYQLKRLDSRDLEAINAHLLELGPDDRSDRFLGAVNDDYLRRYVRDIAIATDILIGAVLEGRLIGLAHAAVYREGAEFVCEVGVSVQAGARKQGLGKQLLLRALDAARRIDVRRAIVLFRATNHAMAGLARSVGGRIQQNAAESCAVFAIDPRCDLPLRAARDARATRVLESTLSN